MAIVREGYSTASAAGSAATNVDEEHTVESGTTISILTWHCRGNKDITNTPSWNTDEDFTLIHESTVNANHYDAHTYIWGIVNPTATTADVSYTQDSSDRWAHTLINYSGTISSSVAAATNYLAEVVDDTGSSTAVFSSAGTSGATLVAAHTGADATTDPFSNNASFAELAEGVALIASGGTGYYVIDKIAGAPSAVTITQSASQEHAAVYIEILPAASTTILPMTARHYLG